MMRVMSDQSTKPNSEHPIASDLKARRLTVRHFAEYVASHHNLVLTPAQQQCLRNAEEDQLDPALAERLRSIIASLPDAPRVASRGSKLGHITITKAMQDHLNGLFDTTGITPALVVRRRPAELPTLTINKVSNWRTGRVRKADPKEWRYVVDALCGIGVFALSQKDKI